MDLLHTILGLGTVYLIFAVVVPSIISIIIISTVIKMFLRILNQR